MKNERTPRTLAEAQFWTGYQSVNPMPEPEPSPQWWCWLLAIAIGASLGALIARSI